MTTYLQRREKIYAPLREERIFTWDTINGQEYALASYSLISHSFREEIAYATEGLGRVFNKIVSVVRRGDEELLRKLGIPPAAFSAVRLLDPEGLVTTIGRFDFAQTADGLKMLAFNSDVPNGIVESFYVNGKVCAYFGIQDPNEGMSQHLYDAFTQTVKLYARAGYATKNIVFSAMGWHAEDRGTAEYLLQISGLKARFVPLGDVRLYQNRLCAQVDGKLIPINVWYRIHPLEILAEDRDDEGFPTGAYVLDVIARRQLAIINPSVALLAQTKALQALIWNLHEQELFFNAEEHRIISTYMLPTYRENHFLGSVPYVTKPILGQAGGAVTLYNRQGIPVEHNPGGIYWNQPVVYQKRVEMEPIQAETAQGIYRGHLLWSSFLVGGRASAIMARLDGPFSSNVSYFLPVGMKN